MNASAEKFLAIVCPALRSGDVDQVVQAVGEAFDPCDVVQFLQHDSADVRRAAALVLGLVGDGACGAVGVLTRALRDPDEAVAKMAEHGLWSVWSRDGAAASAEPFARGVALLGEDRVEEALAQLQEAVALDPNFAEAHNQCAICLYFLGRYDEARDHCQQTLARVPEHFGAMAGLGHCHAHQGRLQEALRCYRQAQAINPMMPCVADAIVRLEAKLAPEAPAGAPDAPPPPDVRGCGGFPPAGA